MLKKLNALLLYDFRNGAQTVKDYVEAIQNIPSFNVFSLNTKGSPRILLEYFDILIIHYSLTLASTSCLSARFRKQIKNFRGLKACFVQDEYQHVDKTCTALKSLGIDVLFTCVEESEFEKVYPTSKIPNLKRVNVLTGYVPENLKHISSIPLEERPFDVIYRARQLPFWCGDLGQDKVRIAEKFQEAGKKYKLNIDISTAEEDRIYGEKWISFLSSSKACLGTESGTSVFDFSGKVENVVEAYQAAHPKASFEEVQEKFFKDLEGKIKLNQISPRIFEAAACKTLLILYEGEYSHVIKPWVHYVPLKKDHSNIEEVIAVLKDKAAGKKIIEAAYEDVILNPQWSYQALTDKVDTVLVEEWKKGKQNGTLKEGKSAEPNSVSLVRGTYRNHLNNIYSQLRASLHTFIFRTLLKQASAKQKRRIKFLLKRFFSFV